MIYASKTQDIFLYSSLFFPSFFVSLDQRFKPLSFKEYVKILNTQVTDMHKYLKFYLSDRTIHSKESQINLLLHKIRLKPQCKHGDQGFCPSSIQSQRNMQRSTLIITSLAQQLMLLINSYNLYQPIILVCVRHIAWYLFRQGSHILLSVSGILFVWVMTAD